jgi:hypothetical protein
MEIEAFVDTDISDCPELTDEQLAQLKPSHYRKQADVIRDERTHLIREEAVQVPAMV